MQELTQIEQMLERAVTERTGIILTAEQAALLYHFAIKLQVETCNQCADAA